MIGLLCPKETHDSVVDIDLDALWNEGIRGLILDLDNTLLGWESDEIPGPIREWVAKAKEAGFRLCIASNGRSSRVRALAGQLGIPSIPKAIKPRKRPFRKALDILGVPPEAAAVIGDQIFTDVLGGNRMDLYTILIKPVSERELKTTRMVRKVERRVLSRLQKKGLIKAGQADR